MLTATWQNEITTPIPSDVTQDSVVDTLHDFGFLIKMSPIVTRYEERGHEGSKIKYDIWENVDLLPFGLWKQEIQFRCAFQKSADGVVSWIEAPLGVTSRAAYAVEAASPEPTTAELVERIESSCSVFLKLFVEKTMVATRKKMHARIMEKAKEGRP